MTSPRVAASASASWRPFRASSASTRKGGATAMRLSISALLLFTLSACGNGSEAPRSKQVASSTPEESAFILECDVEGEVVSQSLSQLSQPEVRPIDDRHDIYRIAPARSRIELWDDEKGVFKPTCNNEDGCTFRASPTQLIQESSSRSVTDGTTTVRTLKWEVSRTSGILKASASMQFLRPSERNYRIDWREQGRCKKGSSPKRSF